MNIEEYIETAKEELDLFKEEFLLKHKNDPENWPIDMEEGEWGEQELEYRF